MNDTVLFVDDEENILNAIRRVFDESALNVLLCNSPLNALEKCRSGQVALLVSDNLMPEMQGVELLERVKSVSPDTVKILMTGHADLPTALTAINSGEVYRFIVKPWDDQELIRAVSEGLGRYRVLSSLHREDESIMKSLAQTIELKDCYTRGHCDRVADYAVGIALQLNLPKHLILDITHGSWLHDCGKIGVPESILNSHEKLTEQEFSTIRQHPAWGASVAEQARLSPVVVNIIRHHHERYDGNGYPDGLVGENIPLEARIVSVADVYDALTSDRPYQPAYSVTEAREIISSLKGNSLDPCLVDVLLATTDPDAETNHFEENQ